MVNQNNQENSFFFIKLLYFYEVLIIFEMYITNK